LARAVAGAEEAARRGEAVVLLLDRLDVFLGASLESGTGGSGNDGVGDGVGPDVGRAARATAAMLGSIDRLLRIDTDIGGEDKEGDSHDLAGASGGSTTEEQKVGDDMAVLAGLLPPLLNGQASHGRQGIHPDDGGIESQGAANASSLSGAPLVPLIVATCGSKEGVSAEVRSTGRLDGIVEADPPSGDVLERAVDLLLPEMFTPALSTGSSGFGAVSGGDAARSTPLARRLAGYLPDDLIALQRRYRAEATRIVLEETCG